MFKWFTNTGSMIDKTSAMLSKWYVELKNCLAEDQKIKTGCGECLLHIHM